MSGTTKKRALIACEFSGVVRDALVAVGWDAWSCDLLPTDRPNVRTVYLIGSKS